MFDLTPVSWLLDMPGETPTGAGAPEQAGQRLATPRNPGAAPGKKPRTPLQPNIPEPDHTFP